MTQFILLLAVGSHSLSSAVLCPLSGNFRSTSGRPVVAGSCLMTLASQRSISKHDTVTIGCSQIPLRRGPLIGACRRQTKA